MHDDLSTYERTLSVKSVKELEVDSTPVKVAWHSKINQVNTVNRVPAKFG